MHDGTAGWGFWGWSHGGGWLLLVLLIVVVLMLLRGKGE